MAARRVAEENKQLRKLLNRYGVSDEYIAHFLQSGVVTPLDTCQDQQQPLRTGDLGAATQSLNQLLLPRHATGLDQGFSFSMPNQSSREASIASGSTASSSVWESPQQGVSSYPGHQRHLGMPVGMMNAQYPPTGFGADSRHDASFVGPQPSSLANSARQGVVTTQSMPITGSRPTVNYQFPMSPYKDSSASTYGFQGPGC
ncbi:hypothetical protein CDD82_6905 [Ophiocordyceps australis]|uniref:Uncharacterized protein n=1 Tax=Ophiocordyceps australis TaxID=1399860 RepID=A0A2C5YU32_9HYPO|nr:hypothetical protein CDD82_6905 [Ophiocordyceps australis]